MDNDFFDKVASHIKQARSHIERTADLTMCVSYYEIGRMIVEQEGSGCAEYGRTLLAELSKYLAGRFRKGFEASENSIWCTRLQFNNLRSLRNYASFKSYCFA
jgi:hypothetical protein